MRIINIFAALSLAAGAAFAGPKAPKAHEFHMVKAKKPTWQYAGEDHGVRFFYRTAKQGAIRIKVENALDTRVDVQYRVMDTDWKKSFASSLAPMAADSSIYYKPAEGRGAGVRYPYFDRVYLERAEGAASAETEQGLAAEPNRT